ncbi:uncharacterized protein LOC143554145 [Bidens hawaiensis]|uniref:uncharacterized protein LOC143554145 n=1 Tax=Bidens hawaiensis TaxID=980011 RepID=UPI004049228D
MATSNPLFSSPLSLSQLKRHAPPPQILCFTTPEESSEPTSEPTTEPSEPGSFDDRLSQVRFRYRSGTGKKADARKSKKTGKKSSGGGNLFLPPVPLKEPTSGGLKVDFGFSPYSERMNGRVAALGLAALVLVELATGESVIKYHSPSIIFIQVYFVAAATAIYCKVEKEKVSVWPSS